jgi:type IV secretion system protein VirD4
MIKARCWRKSKKCGGLWRSPAKERMEYRTPINPGFLGSQWRPKLAALLAFLLVNVAATEYLAWAYLRLGYYFEPATFQIAGVGLYQPFSWIKWEVQYWRWVLHPTPPMSKPLWIAVAIFLIGGLLGSKLISQIVQTLIARTLTKGMEDIYGSSRWAKKRDLKRAGLLDESNLGGVVFGLWHEEQSRVAKWMLKLARIKRPEWIYLRDKSSRHVLVAAATETGKTASTVIMSALEWDGDMLALDVKEEIYKATAGWRQKQGHLCLKFSPKDRSGCARFNPLSFVRLGTDYEISDAQLIAEALGNPGREGENSSHWNETSTSLITGVILHELYKVRREQNRLATLRDVSIGLSPFETDFKAYLQIMTAYEHDPEGVRGWTLPYGRPTKVHPVIWEKAKEALSRAEEEAGSVLSTAKKRFGLFVDPLVNYATSACDWTIEDLIDESRRVSVYMIIPPADRERLAPLIRVTTMCVLNRIAERKVTRRHKVLALLDEVAVLGYVRQLESSPSYIRDYGVKFVFVVQDIGQIVKHYGERNELTSNCQFKLTFAVNELETARTLSATLGTFTVQHASFTFNQKPKLLLDGEGVTANVQNTKRALAEPEELMALETPHKHGDRVTYPGEFVMTIFGCPPVKGRQGFWFLDPKVRKRVHLPVTDQSGALSVDFFQHELEKALA